MHLRIDVPANPEGRKRIAREERIIVVLDDGEEVDLSPICRVTTIRFANREIATADVTFLAIEIGHTTKIEEVGANG